MKNKRTATARLAPSDEPCPLCEVVPLGRNAEHGCIACEMFAHISVRLRARFAAIVLREGRKLTPELKAELAEAANEIGDELLDKWRGDAD